MAFPALTSTLLESLRSKILTSLYGRRFGIDQSGTVVGHLATREAVEVLNSTAASSAAYYGTTVVLTSGSSQTQVNTLQAPPGAGIAKTIFQASTSTGTAQFTASGGAAFLTATDGSSKAVLSVLGAGGMFTLVSLSSLYWAVTGQSPSTAALTGFTTST
jgi:hypothetical protein